MARNINIGLVIGGAIASSMGRAFDDVQSRIGRLEKTGQRARVLQRMIGETQELQRDYQRLAATGSSMADRVQRKLHSNLDALRDQGVAVASLEAAYRKLGATARRAEFRAVGTSNLQTARDGLGQTVAQGVRVGATVAAPAYTAANFQATVRDIAIKAGIANTGQESQVARGIIANGQANGMGRGQMADLVNQLVSAGMDLKQAMSYAPVAAKFSVGQGVSGEDTGKLISAISRNAKITTPEGMAKALSSIAYQGQAGNFEAEDMARWFPDLLAQMQKLGLTGQDSVNQLGAMLQVQRNVAGTSDEAGNNLVNWISKIGAQETVQNYAKAGIDYAGSMQMNMTKHGMSALEASFGLAEKYIEAVDPKRAADMAKGLAGIDKTLDPDKVRAQVEALNQQMRTGHIFTDLQVNAALTAYLQGRKLYGQLKADSAKAGDILDKNLAQRRQTSLQMWKEAGYAWDNALNSMGQAIEPLTDKVAGFAKTAAAAVDTVATKAPGVAEAVLGVVGGLVALKAAAVAFTAVKGIYQIGRSVTGKGWQPENRPAGLPTGSGGPMDRGGVVPVRVINWPKQFGPSDEPGGAVAGAEGSPSAGSRIGKAIEAARGAAKFGGALALIDGAINAGSVFATAKTRDEKFSGYGGAAGETVGATAGAAAGAALGSIVPVAGTALGTIAGSIIGGWAGKTLGELAGKHLATSTAEHADDKSSADADKGAANLPPIQAGPFSPTIQINMQQPTGDPRAWAEQVWPILQQKHADYLGRLQRGQLFDAPMV
ncbi:phage tail tape measure protein [Frateuria aurantia]|uniref:Phage-related minor tail protein n=1 Tax=Frateuria aurantia (strain ATCC 33424 / DSM 6220 / KCTC 2777 / LMG 1558 / NBRC 3245 / NCIMB 13370) TaxID=767434 RepID=H8L2K8_FRAAD|nr:phage tail tape measure protein [Frateuria aurantia]AFC85475.1 Phage-related minor tail protein [Frateuria aurantia DSM 6220]